MSGRVVTPLAASVHSFRIALQCSPVLPWLVLVVVFITAGLSGTEILVFRSVVQAIEQGQNAISPLFVFAMLVALRRSVGSASRLAETLITEQIEARVTQDVLLAASRASLTSFEDPDFRDRMHRALEAAREQSWYVVRSLASLAAATLTSVALTAVLGAVAPAVVPILVVVALGLLLASVVRSRLTYSLEYDDTARSRERRYLSSALTGRAEGKEVRLFGTGGLLLQRHSDLYRGRIHDFRNVAIRQFRMDALGNVAMALALVTALSVVAWNTSLDLGIADAAAAAAATYQLTGQILGMARASTGLFEAARFVDDIRNFERTSTPHTLPIFDATALAAKAVTFTYPGRTSPAVRSVSMEARRGEVVAIVGPNGSGKSTLAKLLCGLYTPDSGELQVEHGASRAPADGVLVGTVSALFQDFARYELSLIDNVMMGAPHTRPDRERAEQLLRQVGLGQAIDTLPDGPDTRLGRQFEDSVDLSIGQWQRVALARAMYSQAPIVVLDEPASSADPRAEREVFHALRSWFPNQAIVVTSHRLSMVESADRILVMKDGAIVERGTHSQLMETGTHYQALTAAGANPDMS